MLPLTGKHVQLKESDVRETEDLLFVVLRDRPLRLLLIVAVELAAQALLVLELFVLLRTTRAAFLGAAAGTYALYSKLWICRHPLDSLLLWRDGFEASSCPVPVWLWRHFGRTLRPAASQTEGQAHMPGIEALQSGQNAPKPNAFS